MREHDYYMRWQHVDIRAQAKQCKECIREW